MRHWFAAALCLLFLGVAHADLDFGDSGGGSSSGGVTFGGVSGGTTNRILFTDASGKLSDSANLTFSTSTNLMTVSGPVTIGTATITVAGSGSSTVGNVNLGFSPSATTGIRYYNDGGGPGMYFDVAGSNYMTAAFGFSYLLLPKGVGITTNGSAPSPSVLLNGSSTGLFAATGQISASIAGVEKTRLNATGLKIGAASDPASTLDVAGSFSLPLYSTAPATASTYTLTSTDYMVTVDSTAGARQVNLPTASGITGRMYTIKKIDASVNAVTIDGNGAETIDTGATYILDDQWDVVTIISNGTNWLIMSRVAAD